MSDKEKSFYYETSRHVKKLFSLSHTKNPNKLVPFSLVRTSSLVQYFYLYQSPTRVGSGLTRTCLSRIKKLVRDKLSNLLGFIVIHKDSSFYKIDTRADIIKLFGR